HGRSQLGAARAVEAGPPPPAHREHGDAGPAGAPRRPAAAAEGHLTALLPRWLVVPRDRAVGHRDLRATSDRCQDPTPAGRPSLLTRAAIHVRPESAPLHP